MKGSDMSSMIRIAAVLCLLMQPFAASAASPEERFSPGMAYYFDAFEPGQKPWKPGPSLNIEEVFKNYQFYEIEFSQDGTEIIVNQYIRGTKTESEKYLRLPDGSLQKK